MGEWSQGEAVTIRLVRINLENNSRESCFFFELESSNGIGTLNFCFSWHLDTIADMRFQWRMKLFRWNLLCYILYYYLHDFVDRSPRVWSFGPSEPLSILLHFKFLIISFDRLSSFTISEMFSVNLIIIYFISQNLIFFLLPQSWLFTHVPKHQTKFIFFILMFISAGFRRGRDVPLHRGLH